MDIGVIYITLSMIMFFRMIIPYDLTELNIRISLI